MSHHIYTTPGFVVSSTSHREAGKFFLLFTRDLGMVGAVAQGVRLSGSKLRYHLQDFSLNLFSLVRGKDVWRLTGATEMGFARITTKDKTKIQAKVLLLLKRLLSGEEKNEKLFAVLEGFQRFLVMSGPEERLELVEILVVLRILHHLGYVSSQEMFFSILSGEEIDSDTLSLVEKHKSLIVKEINHALKESQL